MSCYRYFMAFFTIFFVCFLGIFSEIQDGILRGLQLGNNFGDLNDILAISWQFLAFFIVIFGCSFVFLAISWDIQGKFLPILQIYRSIIRYQQSYTKQSYFPKIFKMPI